MIQYLDFATRTAQACPGFQRDGVHHEPIIRGEDEGIWRRAIKVPFVAQIHPDKRDKDLLQKLKTELPGVLNWALAGCRDWLEGGGLNPPAAVLEATHKYRQKMTPITRFIKDRCLEISDETAGATELYEAYTSWAGTNGERPVSQTAFGTAVQGMGFERKKSGTFHYRGLSLLSTSIH